MTTKEIREKQTEAIQQELVELRKHMYDLRTQAVTEKLENPSQLGKGRRTIARMKTILRQRELEAKAKQKPAEKKVAAPAAAATKKAPVRKAPLKRKTKRQKATTTAGAKATTK
jgi:large subunit ribosomal protein L29